MYTNLAELISLLMFKDVETRKFTVCNEQIFVQSKVQLN